MVTDLAILGANSRRTDEEKAARKEAKKAQKAARRAKREGHAPESEGQKPCDLCGASVDLLVRCQVDAEHVWRMVCGKCWRSVSGGVVDGDSEHPHYRYGGLWKNRTVKSLSSDELAIERSPANKQN